MRFLRRNPRPAKETPTTAPDNGPARDTGPAGTGASGKGRPTPKRREAQARRRGPVAPPPRSQREAIKRLRGNKQERRAERAAARAGMAAGDERYLLPRDRGPVRAYVRDLVDSRRNLMGLLMPMLGITLLSWLVPDARVQYAMTLFIWAALVVIVIEAIFFGRYVNRRVRQKFPDSKDGGFGLAFYAIGRATYLRRWRMPRPRVRYGEAPD